MRDKEVIRSFLKVGSLKAIYTITLTVCFLSLSKSIKAQINFSADLTSGCSPLIVKFSPQAPNAVKWAWDFGNGSTSDLQNPGIAYIKGGEYDVQLIITYANGKRDSILKEKFISVKEGPKIGIVATDTVFCAGEITTFLNLTTETNAEIENWTWDFGDGNTSDQASPTHRYENVGQFNVSLSVTDMEGCSNVATKNQYISTRPIPDASFTAQPAFSCNPPLTVNFTSQETGSPIEHYWDLGNGNISTSLNPSITYTSTGTYPVIHIVSAANGCSDTVQSTKAVQIGNNDLSFRQLPSTACTFQPLLFELNVPNNSQILWEWGNGEIDTARAKVIYTYQKAGNYTIKATLLNGGECTNPVGAIVEVQSVPKATIDYSPKEICSVPTTLSFTHPTNDAQGFAWDFGDGKKSSSALPSHTYTKSGIFSVQLSTTYQNGCVTTIEDTLIIDKPIRNIIPSTFSGCAPLTVTFEPVVSGTFPDQQWQWDFGNGDVSTATMPTYTFNSPGSYQVRAFARIDESCLDTFELAQTINVGQPPQVSFEANQTSSCLRNGIRFQNNSSESDSVFWEFGDANFSNTFNPNHVYVDTGTFDVSLIVSDNGCRDTLVKEDYITILAPRSSFRVDQATGCELPFTIQITDFSVGADTYEWDFGDGNRTDGLVNQHTYTEAGTYPLKLAVTNNETGCLHEAEIPIQVAPINADFTFEKPEGCAPLEVSFQDQTPGSTQWQWEIKGFNSTLSPNRKSFTTSLGPGNYDVRLIASNPAGCADTTSVQNIFSIMGPSFAFTADKKFGCAPLAVTFSPTLYNEADIVSWSWRFGDGFTSSAQNPQHTYRERGDYSVELTVTDRNGCSSTLDAKDFISVFQTNADFTIPLPLSCKEFPVRFINQSPAGDFDYYWDFGDGSIDSIRNPRHLYTINGAFTVKHILTDGTGCSDTVIKSNAVRIRDLEANFTASDTFADCPPLLVNFQSPNSVNDSIVSWLWDFGNNSTSSKAFPAHLYTTPGIFDITLALRDAAGCTDTLTRSNYIRINGPNGTFTAVPLQGCPPLAVSFLASSPNTISYQWDMDDGTLLSGKQIEYVFNSHGLFSPKLILEDSAGCKVILENEEAIEVYKPPVAAFTVDDSLGCLDRPVNFQAVAESDSRITSWDWDLGDGTQANGPSISHTYTHPDNYDIRLKVVDDRGCEDSLISLNFIRVLDNITPNPTDIHVVSVNSNQAVSLTFASYLNEQKDFSHYLLYRKSGETSFNLLDTISNLLDTTYLDQGLDTRNNVFCYEIQVENHCKLTSSRENYQEHCTIELQTIPLQDEILLNWNAYVGWQPDMYHIYRVEGYDQNQRQLLATVDGNTLSFLDRQMDCYEAFSYRIEAIQTRPYSSLSDTSRTQPFHDPPTEQIHTIYATVEKDTSVRLSWASPTDPGLVELILEKNPGSAFVKLIKFELNDSTSYLDLETNVKNTSYSYRLTAVDTCGDLTPYGRIGKSILLKAAQTGGKIKLDWSPYKKWLNNVETYQLEVFDETKDQYATVASLQEGTTSYVDTRTNLAQAVYCYRVTAEEKDGNRSQSRSNLACITISPNLYVPNAFTPNGDGINDRFKIKGPFVKSFQLFIFNRWGERIFTTYSQEDGWDGRTNEGTQVQEGVYVYKVEGKGFDGYTISQAGTVTVIR